jgi:Glycosyltransferase Family 4
VTPRVLMVSPHFPPDASAAAHRVRLLAPHLPKHGWEPTVVSVDPAGYEGRLDTGLAELVPASLRVVRCAAWPARWTRRIGVGDLGLRAFAGLGRACAELLRRERFDALFVTIYPTYPALLGPVLKRRFRVPFVLDYQDPWVGAWGRRVGGGPDGGPDIKSRLARALAVRLEPRAVRAADAITAVSSLTCTELRGRYPELADTPCVPIAIGSEPADFDHLRRRPRPNPYFDARDGRIHLCYVGTVLPLGFETLRAVLAAVARLGERRPELYGRLRLHFFGTSNLRAPGARARVLPLARELGVGDRVTEMPARIDYLDALTVQLDASAILILGSSERHYTASKLGPALLAGRPILAVFHDESALVGVLRRVARPPAARLVTYTDRERAGSRVEAIAAAIASVAEDPVYEAGAVDARAMQEVSAEALTGTLAAVLARVGNHRSPPGSPRP